jgi:predicted dehydrogenase/threonine dehydrogenase-like Zn-dependent dehydrogenase
MKQLVFKQRKVVIENVPTSACGAGQILVENLFSLISSGAELLSSNYPTKLFKGIKIAKEQGFSDAYKTVTNMLQAGVASGYSCCGRVVKVGKDIIDIKKGDIVACAGANIAFHAEFISVPRNLAVKVPDGVSLENACSVAAGSIAIQGVRQADLRIGESAVVIGLGLIGQLTTQILLASGIKVIGVELSKERIKKAKENGLVNIFSPIDKNLSNKISYLTNLQGADATIITSFDSSDNEIINQALLITRKRGKLIVVGDIGLKINSLPWNQKEIELRISTSYGPGRGDSDYENKGIDYPYTFVRWTENRNMQAYLQLLKNKKVDFGSLIGGKYSLEQADLAYKLLNSKKKPLAVLLSYPDSILKDKDSQQFIELSNPQKIEGKIELGIIGIGSFTQAVHLPNLMRLREFYRIRGICTHDQVKAKYFARRYNANIATTDYNALLNDSKINLVMISTRHNLHAQIVIDALKAGKNIFVEKPLCLTEEELKEILDILKTQNFDYSPIIAVGFNRRFSPFIERIKEIIKDRRSPIIINYRVNDSYLAPSHWVNTNEGGGRILGNACGMFDLFCYLIESGIENIDACAITPKDTFYLTTDNFIATIKFKDGSLANLIYTTQGDSQFGKEYMELYSEGRVFVLDDYKKLKTYGVKADMRMYKQNKGFFEELKNLASFLHQKRSPMPLEEIINATKISLEVDKKVRG